MSSKMVWSSFKSVSVGLWESPFALWAGQYDPRRKVSFLQLPALVIWNSSINMTSNAKFVAQDLALVEKSLQYRLVRKAKCGRSR